MTMDRGRFVGQGLRDSHPIRKYTNEKHECRTRKKSWFEGNSTSTVAVALPTSHASLPPSQKGSGRPHTGSFSSPFFSQLLHPHESSFPCPAVLASSCLPRPALSKLLPATPFPYWLQKWRPDGRDRAGSLPSPPTSGGCFVDVVVLFLLRSFVDFDVVGSGSAAPACQGPCPAYRSAGLTLRAWRMGS
jgi:hypothetical protein